MTIPERLAPPSTVVDETAKTTPMEPGARILKNASVLSGGELVGRALTFLAVVHLSRVLGPAGMGVVDLGTTVHGVVLAAALGGVEILAIRRAARSKGRLDRLAGTVMLTSWIVFLPIFLGLVVLGLLVPDSRAVWRAAPYFAAAVAVGITAPRFAFFGRENMGVIALSTLVAQTAYLALAFVFVTSASHISRVPWVWLACESARSLFVLAVFRKQYGKVAFTTRARAVWRWVRAAVPLTLARLGRVLLLSLDPLMLGVLAAPAEVGIYTVAQRLPIFLAGLSISVHIAMLPVIARSGATGDKAVLRRTHSVGVESALGAALPCIVAIAVVAQPLTEIIYGPAFAPSGVVLRLLVWKVAFVAVSGMYRNVLLSQRPADETRVTLTALVVAVVAMVTLIPLFGIIGAAAGSLIGELALLVLYARSTREWVPMWPKVGSGWLARLVPGLVAVALVPNLFRGAWQRVGSAVAVGGVVSIIAVAPLAKRLFDARRAGGQGPA